MHLIQPRDWREPFTSAVDAYRNILRLIRDQTFALLKFDEIDHLAANCPRCFGPPVGVTKPEEPDYIVCMDGNFQHRRHAAASVPIPGYKPDLPELFMKSEKNIEQNPEGHDNNEEIVSSCMICLSYIITYLSIFWQHPCSEQHTAANDVRGRSHWGGRDETGLFGMGCRHDHTLRIINVVQSGEKY